MTALHSAQAAPWFTLGSQEGLQARFTSYGLRLTELWVPDAQGERADVVLGYDDLPAYKQLPDWMMGAIIGRYAHRISPAHVVIDGQAFPLEENLPHQLLHSGTSGFHRQQWEVTHCNAVELRARLSSKAGDSGFPGQLEVSAVYRLEDPMVLSLSLEAETDAPTPANFTQHAYFNLAGFGDISDHVFYTPARHYMPASPSGVVTGEILDVDGALDFGGPELLASRLRSEHPELIQNQGFDLFYWLQGHCPNQAILQASCYHPASGRSLAVYSNRPGFQFFTANKMKDLPGKNHQLYGAYAGFCVEPQYAPITMHAADSSMNILRPGERYHQTIIYDFRTALDPLTEARTFGT